MKNKSKIDFELVEGYVGKSNICSNPWYKKMSLISYNVNPNNPNINIKQIPEKARFYLSIKLTEYL